MNKLGDVLAYVSMVAELYVLTRPPRPRPPLYVDRDGTFHWRVRADHWPGAAEAIRAETEAFRRVVG